MKNKELTAAEQFAELEKTLRADGRLQVDEAKLELSEQILELMEDKGITEAELARLLGKSRAYVNKVLQGSTNFTIKSLVQIGLALNCELKLEFSEIEKDVLDAEIIYTEAKEPIKEPKIISKPKGLEIAKLYDFSAFKTNKAVKDIAGNKYTIQNWGIIDAKIQDAA